MASGHLAVDLGASSGRVMFAVLRGEPKTLTLTEAHRFEHQPLDTPAGPVWDFTFLWREILAGLREAARCAEREGVEVRSVGVDTWAVDWALLDAGGELLGLPHAYRDPANLAAKERVLARLPGGLIELYRRTGIQPQPFNTLFQLDARHEASPELFRVPHATLHLLPDLIHFFLTGVRTVERTNASSTALLSAESHDWDPTLLESTPLPRSAFLPLIDPGTVVGPLRPAIAREVGLSEAVTVVAPGTHDTASAVAAAPVTERASQGWAYLSSGTWSLLGVESDRAITTPEALETPFTNELGVGGKVRVLRNIAGLWLVQQLRADLARQGEQYDYAQLADLAAAAPALRTLVDPNTPDLAAPGDSIRKLRDAARASGQPEPKSAGELARCCFDSLALSYAETIDRIEALTNESIDTLYIVGGGVKNQLLNRLTSDAIGRRVVAGPSEATAIGNAMVQAMGLGLIADLAELRTVVARSEPVQTLEPATARDAWRAAHARYAALITGGTN